MFVITSILCYTIINKFERNINMLVKDPKFEISAVSPAQYPDNNLPQIVLVGKSNVIHRYRKRD